MSLVSVARIIPVLLLALAAGCSALKLGYTSLPQVVYWWLDGFADFDDAQEQQARDAIAGVHTWHRREELPRVVELLERMERMAVTDFTAQQACELAAEGQVRLAALADHAAPVAGAIAVTLRPQQLQHMEAKYRQRNEKFRRDWITRTPAERHARRYDQMLDRLETLYGRLEAPQRNVLRQAVERSMHDPERVLAEFRRRQQDTLAALRQATVPGATPEQAGRLLHATMQRVQQSADPAYRQWQQALLQETCGTFAAVHQATTPAQRAHAVQRLRGWQADLRELSLAPRP